MTARTVENVKELALEVSVAKDAPKPYRICFVCTGNTCRSPMAEAVANALIKELGRQDLRAFSAGLFAVDGDAISAHAVRALEEAGIPALPGHDYRRHVAHRLREQDVAELDLLVGLTEGHAMQLLLSFPEAADKITAMPHSVSDPYGGDLSTYKACLAQIRQGVCELLSREDRA